MHDVVVVVGKYKAAKKNPVTENVNQMSRQKEGKMQGSEKEEKESIEKERKGQGENDWSTDQPAD